MTDLLALQRVCERPDFRVNLMGNLYVENGRPVLPFLADGLAALIEVGHLRLGEPDPASCSMRPVLVTASGRARYEELCDRQGVSPYPTTHIRRPGTSVMIDEDGMRWVFDPDDRFAHVLADSASARAETLMTMCKRELPADHTPTFSVAPSLAVCPRCARSGRSAHPPAVFPTPTHY